MKHCANSFAVVRKISIAVLLLLGIGLGGLTSMVSAQRIAPVNQWTAYTSHNSPKQIVKVGDEFYVISKGGLFTYNLITKKTRSFTSVEGMSQIDPTAIHYHAATGNYNKTTDRKSVV